MQTVITGLMSIIYHKIPNKTVCAILSSGSCFKYSNCIKAVQQSEYLPRQEEENRLLNK